MDPNTNTNAPQAQKTGNNMLLIAGVVILLVVGAAAWFLMSQNNNTTPQENTAIQQPATENQTPTTEESTGETSPAVDSAMDTGEVKEFTVSGRNFSFSPSQLRVKEGDTVKITFENTGGFHDFTIDEFNVKTKQIQDGQSETVEFVASKKGTYEYYCSVGRHRENGMRGNLIVE